ncbi:unnamed protein product [Anisakis simplex]|uniref:ABC transmembrane type-1 domain-containing protein n=1 Tax=Anisakis simplex TaxID=6269 RepID=A0A0M3J8W2_ANISI|nr:unnamed protein product [Anisakis simplex]
MYQALTSKNQTRFKHVFLVGSFEYVGNCALLALVIFFSWQLYLAFRKNAVEQLSNRYFNHRAYYNINCIDDRGIDNP